MDKRGETNTKHKVLSGLFWKLMERGGTHGIQFIVQIILARLLLPKDYGLISLITIFIVVANVFVQSGFSTALVQKKDVDETDLSSVFYLSLFVAGLLYIAFFFLAPFIAAFYKEPKLISILRVLSITLFFGAINSIQYAIVSRTMQFRRFFFSSLGGITISGTVGIVMASAGLGAWALVGQQLVNNVTITIILWFTVRWRPGFVFSIHRLKNMFSFGWKLLCSSLLDTVYNNLYGLVIGKVYNPETLAYYNRGYQFPNLIVTNIDGSIQSVLFPALSANQDDKKRIKSMVRRSIVTSSFIIFPLMIGLAVCARPLIRILLTAKWLPCVPFLQIMCISFAFWPIHTANLQAINAVGRSDIFLKLEVLKKIIGVLALVASIKYGVLVMVSLQPVVSFISTIINSYPNKKLLDYSFKEQWMDIMPSMLLALFMGAVVYSVEFLKLSSLKTLIIQVVLGAVVYNGIAYVIKLECSSYLLTTIKDLMGKKINRGVAVE